MQVILSLKDRLQTKIIQNNTVYKIQQFLMKRVFILVAIFTHFMRLLLFLYKMLQFISHLEHSVQITKDSN
jgi:hypothetical protein